MIKIEIIAFIYFKIKFNVINFAYMAKLDF